MSFLLRGSARSRFEEGGVFVGVWGSYLARAVQFYDL
jgi:hypothetical protein